VRDETIALRYAETLFELAERHEGVEAYGEGIELVGRLLNDHPDFRRFLETPRINAEAKKAMVRKVFGDVLPKKLTSFLLLVIDKRRQRLLQAIALQFHLLVDEHHNRTHVEVTVARQLDDGAVAELARRLTGILGKEAILHVQVRPQVLGGVVVRTGHTIYDGSLRRRLEDLRQQMLTAKLPKAPAEPEAAK
jgi:F-type H+-transporting ATPase subunit delta